MTKKSMYSKISLCAVFLFFVQYIQAQVEQLKITPPIEIPLCLSGTFGELRQTHFHAGLDISTKGMQGLAVRSILKGFVSCIRVSTRGYGKTLYIQHMNGTTSVYAHLKKFSPEIEAYVKGQQYKKESYTIQLHPKQDEIKVEAGGIIGYSGNTGRSFGPHLHFEVRNSSDQNPINPLRYFSDVKDTERPQIQGLYLYSSNEDRSVENRKEIPLIRVNDSLFGTELIQTNGTVSIGLRMFDQQNLSRNKNGIYHVKVLLNGQRQIEYNFERISFNDSKYIGLFVDYEAQRQERMKIQRIICHPKSKKSFLNKDFEGYMKIETGKSYKILVEISDLNKNRTYIELYVIGSDGIKEFKILPGTRIQPDIDHLFEFDDRQVYFPKKTFFGTVYLNLDNRGDTLVVDKDRYPVFNPYEVTFKTKLKGTALQQSFIAKLNDKGESVFLKTNKKGSTFSVKVKSLGTFIIDRDSIAPEITPVNFRQGQWLSNFKYLIIKIKDDFSGVKSYRGTINGQWVLFEYEPKDNTLTYDFNDLNFDSSKLKLELEVEDNVGNKSLYSADFFRKTKNSTN